MELFGIYRELLVESNSQVLFTKGIDASVRIVLPWVNCPTKVGLVCLENIEIIFLR